MKKKIVSAKTIIHVDRSIRPTYPAWMKRLIHPKLGSTGPALFEVNKLEQWLHEDQKQGTVEPTRIYRHLKKKNMLKRCLGLRDLEEIEKKGVSFFRRFSKGKAVVGWKSLLLLRTGDIDVPCLRVVRGRVRLHWYPINNSYFDATFPVWYFA